MNEQLLKGLFSALQSGARAMADGGLPATLSPQDEQVRFLQDASNNVKRSGFYMKRALVRLRLQLWQECQVVLRAVQEAMRCRMTTTCGKACGTQRLCLGS